MSSEEIDSHSHHDGTIIESMVTYQGFALFHVESKPELTHTIGLYSRECQCPELLISGLQRQTRVDWMLDLGFQMKGPPSRQALEDQSRLTGIPIDELAYPLGGAVFKPGCVYFLAQNDYPGCFGVVEVRHYDQMLWHVQAYHGIPDFPVLQFVWSDPQGHFPWSVGYNQRRYPQQVLFDPVPLLPLLERAQ